MNNIKNNTKNNINKFNNFYLFSDIDGTLANLRDDIPQKNLDAIKYFVDNGGTFGVATGRYLGDIDLLNNVDINGLCILNNGASIYDFDNKELLHSEILPENIIEFYVDYLNKNKNIGLLIVNDDGYITAKFDDLDRPILDSRYKVQNLDDIKLPYYKIMFVIKNNENNKQAKEIKEIKDIILELKELAQSSHIKNLYNIDYVQTGEYTLEVIPKNVSKGDALSKICDDHNIAQENTYFIGDSFNDITIMNKAKFSGCVSHAPEQVKQYADFITCNFEDGAVADFIEYIDKNLV